MQLDVTALTGEGVRTMAGPHLDHPGEVHWFSGYGPRQVIALCSHDECRHHALTTVAWGPDMTRYELVECDADCAGDCRAWIDGRGVVTSQWLAVANPRPVTPELRR